MLIDNRIFLIYIDFLKFLNFELIKFDPFYLNGFFKFLNVNLFNFNFEFLLFIENFLKNCGIKELYKFSIFFKNNFENSDLILILLLKRIQNHIFFY
jgi:hypothetical protein